MNKFYNIYFSIPSFQNSGLVFKAINKILFKLFKFFFEYFVRPRLSAEARSAEYGLNKLRRKEKYIVSLTSFPARINEVWVTIDTLLRQSFKPDEIILWLAESQFPDKLIPTKLNDLKKRGLTVKFCNEDLRAHKKYYYAFKEFPKANILTVDDDVYYHRDTLLKLYELNEKHKNSICANRAHLIRFDQNGELLPYRKWLHNYKKINKPSNQLLQVGVGGVLYPPNSIDIEVFNKEVFKELCFYADDLWLKVMAFRKGTKIVTGNFFNKDFITVGETQKEKLVNQNVLSGGNDTQLQAVLKHFNISPRVFYSS